MPKLTFIHTHRASSYTETSSLSVPFPIRKIVIVVTASAATGSSLVSNLLITPVIVIIRVIFVIVISIIVIIIVIIVTVHGFVHELVVDLGDVVAATPLMLSVFSTAFAYRYLQPIVLLLLLFLLVFLPQFRNVPRLVHFDLPVTTKNAAALTA